MHLYVIIARKRVLEKNDTENMRTRESRYTVHYRTTEMQPKAEYGFDTKREKQLAVY